MVGKPYIAGYNLDTGDNNLDIGNVGVAGESNTIRIGQQVAVTGFADFPDATLAAHTATYIAGIFGETTGDAGSTTPVVIDMNGNLGTAASSEGFKTDIEPMDKTSEAVFALKPVTFHYKKDTKRVPQFGLVSEEVSKVNPAMVARDAKGDIYTVRYEAVNAMLLNEFLKEHRIVQEQKATVAQLKQDFQSRLAHQQKQIEALTAGLQKVSAQVEMSRPTPQTIVINH
jgi:Chaperone of endosialidase